MTDTGAGLTNRKNLRLTFVETLSHQIDNEDAIERLLRYLEAGEEEVRLEVVRILSMTSSPKVCGALEPLLSDPNPTMREQALKSLVRIFPDNIFTYLKRGAQDESEWVRLVAVKYLPHCHREKVNVREILLGHLADANPDVVAQAVDSLSQIGDRQIVRPLFEKLRGCQQVKVQSRIVEALAALNCDDLIEVIFEKLWDTAALSLRISLVRALGQLKEHREEFRDWLLELLADQDPFVRANAIHAIASSKLKILEAIIDRLGDDHELVIRAAQEVLLQLAPHTPALASLVIKALEDAKYERGERLAAAGYRLTSGPGATTKELKEIEEIAGQLGELLQQLPNQSLALLLVKILKSPRRVYLDRLLAIVGALPIERSRQYQQAIVRACSLPHPWMRYQLVTLLNLRGATQEPGDARRAYRLNLIELLSRIRATQAIHLFVEMLDQEEEPVKIAIIHALGEIGEERGVRAIRRFANHPEWLVRVNVAQALGKIGGQAVFPLLEKLAEDKHPWVRFNAVEAVRKMVEVDTTEFFAAKLSDPDEKVRATAVMGLGLNATKDHFDALTKMLHDSDDRVRANAVEAISFLQGRGINEFQVKQSLLKLMEDPHHRVRANAALALYTICKEDVLKELKNMLAAEDRWIRSAAVYALGEIGDISAASLLIEMLYDEDSRVRMNTVKALSKIRGEDINRMVIDSISVVEEKVLQAVNESLENEIEDAVERQEYRKRIKLQKTPAQRPDSRG